MLESRRVAELLAQLPKEVSVEALIMEAMGRPVIMPNLGNVLGAAAGNGQTRPEARVGSASAAAVAAVRKASIFFSGATVPPEIAEH